MVVVKYAVYSGDKYLISGTALQLARHFGVKLGTVKFWATPSYKKRGDAVKNPTGNRRYAIRIED